jgi:beta-N-acetylhexosaminidase
MRIFLILIFVFSNLVSSKDLFEDYYKDAEEIVKNMSIFEKIGQMFIGRYDKNTAEDQINKYHIGGFCLFANNLVDHTEEQLINELETVQNKSKIRLTYSVDEEGGTVCRVSLYFREERFPSPRDSYTKGGINEILSIEKEKRELLKKLDFSVNFAPVADVSTNTSDYIYYRTLGENASLTSDYISSVVDDYVEDEFCCCLKHFPRYGNNRNTHDDVAHDYRDLDYLKQNDLIPFVKAIDHKVPMIMFSHNIVHSIDGDYPASISKKVHDLLRNEYGYTGIIITDSLSMGAIAKYATNVSAGVLAVEAGNDIILTSTFEEHINQVLKAYEEHQIDEALINKAAKRVIAWKLKYLYKREIIQPTGEPSDEFNEDSDETLYIVLGVVLGLITILIIFLLFLYFSKKKKNENKETPLENDEDEIPNEKLIRDSTQSAKEEN